MQRFVGLLLVVIEREINKKELTMIYIALDFETTGLDCFSNQIIEIGAVKFNSNGDILGEYQKLVKPSCEIEPGAESVHKISKAMLTNELSIVEVWDDFIEWCGDFSAFVAHNASFEAGYIYQLYGDDLPDFQLIDTLRMARSRMPDRDSYKLTSLIPTLKDGHRALPDALATKDLLLELILTYKSKKLTKTQLKSIYEMLPTHPDEATDRQLNYIESLGGDTDKVRTKQEASIYIDSLLNNNKSVVKKTNTQHRNLQQQQPIEADSNKSFWTMLLVCLFVLMLAIPFM